MFEIASYRIEHAFDEILGMNVTRKCCSYCTKIINAVSMQRRAIIFTEFLRSSFAISYVFLISLGVVSLSVNMLRLFLATQYLSDFEELIIATLFVLGHIYYIFLGNYTGQKLIDYSMGMFYKIYESQWYVAPLHAQKLLLFMMQRSIKSISIRLGGIFVPSLEGFATITSMSLSYFTVIRAVQ
ncbi:PREDICTED: uncharacterized protein LOC106748295 [Dinoponera quadriceps]|uniref:Uncharacterized protein LOC106748295 n=1 Tax=Dinoponera quadriceps TaxID=609295 RepID=A0A6P3XVQ2_DINQU|nr:PREDICTED: uncharacterized protein LOC106748295 [Dinoponera quadriceps]